MSACCHKITITVFWKSIRLSRALDHAQQAVGRVEVSSGVVAKLICGGVASTQLRNHLTTSMPLDQISAAANYHFLLVCSHLCLHAYVISFFTHNQQWWWRTDQCIIIITRIIKMLEIINCSWLGALQLQWMGWTLSLLPSITGIILLLIVIILLLITVMFTVSYYLHWPCY